MNNDKHPLDVENSMDVALREPFLKPSDFIFSPHGAVNTLDEPSMKDSVPQELQRSNEQENQK